jgi:hypothetical protein
MFSNWPAKICSKYKESGELLCRGSAEKRREEKRRDEMR